MYIGHCFLFKFNIDLFSPAELNVDPQSTSISLSWEYYNNCSLTSCTFMYEVTWQQSENGSNLRNTTTTETSYTIEGLTPGTSYKIGVGTYCKENPTIRSEGKTGLYKTLAAAANTSKLISYNTNVILLWFTLGIVDLAIYTGTSDLMVILGIAIGVSVVCIILFAIVLIVIVAFVHICVKNKGTSRGDEDIIMDPLSKKDI